MTLETFKEIYSQPKYTVNNLVDKMVETADLYATAKYHKAEAQSPENYDYYRREADHMFKRLCWLADKIKEKIANGD